MINFDSEKSLEDFIFDHWCETGDCLIDDTPYKKCIRQLDLGEYGIPDLVFVTDRRDFPVEIGLEPYNIHVVELKNKAVKVQDLAQISRYKTCFEQMFDEFECEIYFTLLVPYDGVPPEEQCYLINELKEVSVLSFKLNPKSGIEFQCCGPYTRTIFDKNKYKQKLISIMQDGE